METCLTEILFLFKTIIVQGRVHRFTQRFPRGVQSGILPEVQRRPGARYKDGARLPWTGTLEKINTSVCQIKRLLFENKPSGGSLASLLLPLATSASSPRSDTEESLRSRRGRSALEWSCCIEMWWRSNSSDAHRDSLARPRLGGSHSRADAHFRPSLTPRLLICSFNFCPRTLSEERL